MDSVLALLQKHPIIFESLTENFKTKELKNIESTSTDFLNLVSIFGKMTVLQRVQNICEKENIEFIYRYHLSLVLNECHENFQNGLLDNKYSISNEFLAKISEVHIGYFEILAKHNPYMRRHEFFAARTLKHFIKNIINNTDNSLFSFILDDKYKIFYYKYFHILNTESIRFIFNYFFDKLSDIQSQDIFCFNFFDFLILLDRCDLAKELISSLIHKYDKNMSNDYYKVHVMTRALIKLLRMDLTIIDESISLNKFQESLTFSFELLLYKSFRSSISHNEIFPQINQVFQALQNQRSPSSVFYVLKKVVRIHQLTSDFDDDFYFKVSLYFVQYTNKHFNEYSYYFVRALKALTLMIFQLGLPSRYLSEKLLGLSEILYYCPSKMLSSANLILSKSIYFEFKINHIPITEVEIKIVKDYAIKAYDISLNVLCELTKLKALLWLLQITDKFTVDNEFNPAYRWMFTDICVIIDSIKSCKPHKHDLYLLQLELVDILHNCVEKRSVTLLSEDQIHILNNCHKIDMGDSLSARKMKVFARVCPLVERAIELGICGKSRDGYEVCKVVADVTYKRLLARPEDEVFYDRHLWKKTHRPKKELDGSGTEDSDSDSLSDSSYCDL